MTATTSRRQNSVICLCLVLATAAVYWPVQHYGFVSFDDEAYVYQNPHLQGGLTLRGLSWAFTTGLDQWMPVTWLARLLEWQFFGLNAGAHHLINLLFHIANTLLLFIILNKMTGARWRSAFVAALFALHPLHVESVAWVTGLKDVLSMFFGLLTIWAYVRYTAELSVIGDQLSVRRSPLPASQSPAPSPITNHRSPSSAFYILTLVLFALAVMSKPMMVTLPFVLLLLDIWPFGRTRWAMPALTRGPKAGSGKRVGTPLTRLLGEKIPFLVPAAVSCVLTIWARHNSGALTPLDRLPLGDRADNAVVSYVIYLRQLVWPTDLAVLYPFRQWPGQMVVGAGVLLVLLSALVIRSARRNPHLLMGWLWYLGTMVPVIGLVQVGNLAMADRYTYLPFVGLFIMVAWSVPAGAVERPERKRIIAAVAVVLLGVYAVLCRQQVGYWENTGTLFRRALKVTTNNWIAHYNLGVSMVGAGTTGSGASNIQEVLGHFEESVRINPNYAEAHYNLGISLIQQGKLQEAIQHWEQAVRLKPNYPAAEYNLGMALSLTGRSQEAIWHFEQAVKFKPDYTEAHFSLGLALEQMGRVPEAISNYDQALRIKPEYPEAENNLAWLLATLAPADGGNPARAVTLAKHLCDATGHRVAPFLDTLAAAYAAAGRFGEAIATARKAIDMARSGGQPQVAKEVETRLELYRDGRAYRQPRITPRKDSST